MIKLIFVSIFSLFLSACGDSPNSDSSSLAKAKEQSEKVLACDVLTEFYFQSAFSGATDIQKNEHYASDKTCGYEFKYEGTVYVMHMVLQIANFPEVDEESLNHYVKYIAGSEPLDSVGEKAYYSESMPLLTALGKQSLIQVGASAKKGPPSEAGKKIAMKIAVDMLNILDQ